MLNALKKRKSCADETDEAFGTTKRTAFTKDSIRTRSVNILAEDINPRKSETSSPSLFITSENRNVRDSSAASFSVSGEQGGATSSGTSSLLSLSFDLELAF
ncbi:hypothetical protein CIB48_g6709 [Xylaria polymorpha]|nr:hypothetical protein CIB48_g6709 [Xylaria polymorpha]